MNIKIIVPVYNALDDVKKCLQSLAENLDFNCSSVICIDDCSLDETRIYVKDFCEKHSFEYIRNEKNLGFVKTCNAGLRKAFGGGAALCVLLNSDTIIPSDFCEKIIKCFESNSEIGIASPIASFSGTYYIPKPVDVSIEEMNGLLDVYHKPAYPQIVNGEGFCFCIKKSVIEKQGFLDEVYGMGYNEEVDYSFQAQKNGFKCVLIDNLYVYHRRNCLFGKEMREKLIAQNYVVFNERWGEFLENLLETLKNPCPAIMRKILLNKPFVFLKFEDRIIICILGIKFTLKILQSDRA